MNGDGGATFEGLARVRVEDDAGHLQLRRGDASYADEPLQAHLDALGAYDRYVMAADGAPLRVRVYRADGGTLRIRVGRWQGDPA